MAASQALVLACILLHSAETVRILSFESFVQVYSRSYVAGSAEYAERQELYERRREVARLHNSQSDRLYTQGVNKLWDWTDSELQQLRGWDGSVRPEGAATRSIRRHTNFLQQRRALPTEKIWNNLTMAQEVKDQGGCGSCWAIAAASVLEAHYEIYRGKPRTFSAQQIVMCTPNPRHCGGAGGCQGATAELAMDWVMQHGCADATTVPYTGLDAVCNVGIPTLEMAQVLNRDHAAPASAAAQLGLTGWETLPKNKYEPLVAALAEKGPVAVSVAARDWFNYESGIFNGCGKDAVIDHAVTAIGYGVEGKIKYWVILNSWGKDWGEHGIIRLERHDGDTYCGMNNDPQKGTACEGENDPVPVCGMCGILYDSVVPHFG
mmetsp:Transcript_97013/g.274100  ORF Transcript_97013/g.274100 Transcript_97013/m.274100 type:complete len:378 (-) Transcript_97013:116-1249(-)|eukprot:CAMPEP_0117556718 /NCGR_PEP_ID=MMETSP0784-20121206/51954_1 /TAXON_ID=39447 /ORGANISM="" /LENGTH=377 /DNA_ID=CAMNT_0005354003 /DNA_START=45 /DNA_END=1178 /DNA_ORIENTATION=-